MSGMKRAILTGAAGFLGRYLTAELLRQDYEVFALVRPGTQNLGMVSPSIEPTKKLHILPCDMSDYRKTLQEHADLLTDISCLYHLAWRGVSDSGSRDYTQQLTNVQNSCDLMQAAHDLGVKRMVFADSIMEFEHLKGMTEIPDQLPLRNMYHTGKLAARSMLSLLATDLGMDFIPCVVSNVYGEGENSPRLINTAIRRMLKREHMSFTEGRQLYDFIYVEDAVRAMILAGESGTSHRLYYIGNAQQKPLAQYLRELRDILAPGLELGLGEIPFRGVSLDYSEFDTQALYWEFDFHPRISFEEGVRRTAQWIQQEGIL